VAVPPGRGAEANPAQALVVAEPEVDRSLAITGIAARDGKGAIAYFPKAVWVDRPARLFLDLLADTIRASGNRVVIAEDAETPAGAQRLSGRLTSFGYDEASRSAIVRYDALLRAPGPPQPAPFRAVEKVSRPRPKRWQMRWNAPPPKWRAMWRIG
jgi:cholesterol transport system auxiliary component